MITIGFLVNPVAGMGGSVGLKGTDGLVAEAIRKGAVPRAGVRAQTAIECLARIHGIRFVTCSGDMGENVLRKSGIAPEMFEVVYQSPQESTAEDTKKAAALFAGKNVALILFCGGDGTARDILDSVKKTVPILGIPAGVKMYSSVFAVDPPAAADIVAEYARSQAPCLRDAEVMDVDEVAYREGTFSTKLYGYAKVPCAEGKVQTAKQVFEEADETRAQLEIARFISDVLLPDAVYILGPGTTVGAVANRIGVRKTLLGVDVIKNRMVLAQDADEKTLLKLTEKADDVWIIVSPIGAQGFIFGRGNQQISSRIVKKAGVGHIVIVATPHKLRETPVLYVDTGDTALDASFGDSIQAISGYCIARRVKIAQHSPVK